ncbi:hypothetical protein OCV73_00250 [Barnesiella propionica]|uniref:hypothetical protein n=1 Tax=Barnesiella propionica TaxID=2981781 RepID=UPI0011C7BF76|nr:hypothetical protein [Barnesiella propionica]MCU6767392.1 hypothetical protein [Barnesiella propionica]
MEFVIYIAVLLLCALIFFLWNPNTRRIRKIQSLINKDRSVCDVINYSDGWNISNVNVTNDALVIMVDPGVMPIYKLYITYKNRKPTNSEIRTLYHELTNDNSIVSKAHKANMPVENYIEQKGYSNNSNDR